MVLIQEDNTKRLDWLLGVVEKLHTSSDGVVRSMDVRTSGGIRTRPVQRIHNLEISNLVSAPDEGLERSPIPQSDDVRQERGGASSESPVVEGEVKDGSLSGAEMNETQRSSEIDPPERYVTRYGRITNRPKY